MQLMSLSTQAYLYGGYVKEGSRYLRDYWFSPAISYIRLQLTTGFA